MADTCETTCDTIYKGIARELNGLQDENRLVRKSSLETIKNSIVTDKLSLEENIVHELLMKIYKPILKSFSDPVEKCRELSLELVVYLWTSDVKAEDILPYLIPIAVQRLGQKDIVEPSEEIRLTFVKLIFSVIERCRNKLLPYLDELIQILTKTITDPYPEIKKESCKCASELAVALSSHFHTQSESLINPLLKTLTHQHAKVRQTCVYAIGNVVQYGNNKSVEDVVTHLAQRLFDYSPLVRLSITDVVGRWLVELADRYSFFHRLIPLLLTSLTDEVPEIQLLAEKWWIKVGEQYEKENEEDLKDLLDFAEPNPSHYPLQFKRPNLGCRVLIHRHFSTILPSLLNDLEDWVLETRIKAGQLLYMLLLNGEDTLTQHVSRVLTALYKSGDDTHQEVVAQVEKSAEMIGYFIKPSIYCHLVLENIRTSPSPSNLLVLASIIRGTEQSKLSAVIKDICDVVSEPEICQDMRFAYQVQLINFVQSVITAYKSNTKEVSLQLFKILLTVRALAADDDIREQVCDTEKMLCKDLELECVYDLFDIHLEDVLKQIVPTQDTWVASSPERFILDTILCFGGSALGKHLDILIPMITANLKPDKDAQIRLRFFTSLSNLMLNITENLNSCNKLEIFITKIIEDIILPNLIWQAGKTAIALRTAAISCLWATFQSKCLTADHILPSWEKLSVQLISTLEDDSRMTRLITCRVLQQIFDLCKDRMDMHKLHNIYPELMKRLEDVCDEIRIVSVSMLQSYFHCFQDQFDPVLYRTHIEDIYSILLLHMDDQDEQLQIAIFNLLKEIGTIHPDSLQEQIQKVKGKHRTPTYCIQLLEILEKLKSK